jgi:hypothetical protein
MTTETIARIATAVYAVVVVPLLLWFVLGQARRQHERLDERQGSRLGESSLPSGEDWARFDEPTYLRSNRRASGTSTR